MWYIIIGVVILYLLYKFVTSVVAPIIFSFGVIIVRIMNFIAIDLWTSLTGTLVVAILLSLAALIILIRFYLRKARFGYQVAELNKERRKKMLEHVMREATFEKLLPFYSTSTGIGMVIASRVLILTTAGVSFAALCYALFMPGFLPNILFSGFICLVLLTAGVLYAIQRFGKNIALVAGIAAVLAISAGLFAGSLFFAFDGRIDLDLPVLSFVPKEKVKNFTATTFELDLSKKIPMQFSAVKASSHLPADEKFSYGPKLVFDNEPSTAWIEGNASTGVDETLFAVLASDITASRAYIINGYASRETTWKRNDRILNLQITYYLLPQDEDLDNLNIDAFSVASESITLEDTMTPQTWNSKAKTFNAFELRIISVVSGENGFKDCCLSEFGFLQK